MSRVLRRDNPAPHTATMKGSKPVSISRPADSGWYSEPSLGGCKVGSGPFFVTAALTDAGWTDSGVPSDCDSTAAAPLLVRATCQASVEVAVAAITTKAMQENR